MLGTSTFYINYFAEANDTDGGVTTHDNIQAPERKRVENAQAKPAAARKNYAAQGIVRLVGARLS
jgi:hypothetical protein